MKLKTHLLFLFATFTLFSCKNQFDQKIQNAKIEYAKENFQKSIELTNQLPFSKDKKVELLFIRGKSYFFNKQLKLAEKTFNKILKINKSYYEAKIWLVRILILLSENQKARTIINCEKKNNSNDWRIFYFESLLEKSDKNLSEEIYSLQKSKDCCSQSYKVFKRLNEIWKDAGLQDQAFSYLELENLLLKMR